MNISGISFVDPVFITICALKIKNLPGVSLKKLKINKKSKKLPSSRKHTGIMNVRSFFISSYLLLVVFLCFDF